MRVRLFVASCVACFLSCLFAAADAAAQDAAPPGIRPSTESVFTPIQPCRLFNTRIVGGRIPAKRSRTFQVAGSSGFPAQGGKADGCGIPEWANAVSMTLTAVDADRGGYLTAYATGGPRPDAFTVIYPPAIASAGNPIVRIASGMMTVYSESRANVMGDVTGYYAEHIRGTITREGTIQSATSRIRRSVKSSIGNYFVVVDRNMDGCAISAVANNGEFRISAFTRGNDIIFYVRKVEGGFYNPDPDTGFRFLAQC